LNRGRHLCSAGRPSRWALAHILVFVCNFVKNQRILMQLSVVTVRINDERYMWRYELHPPHLINVATLPCESRNSKNVISQWDITKQNCIKVSYMLHRNGPVDYKILGAMQQCLYGTKICDIYDLQNAWRKLGLTLNRTLLGCDWPVVWPFEIMCVCWWRTLWTHAAKLLFICIMWFIRTFCETVNVIWCIWGLFWS